MTPERPPHASAVWRASHLGLGMHQGPRRCGAASTARLGKAGRGHVRALLILQLWLFESQSL